MSGLNASIIKIRVALQNAKIKKTGKNQHAGFSYFELADFLPKLNELMLEEGINDIVSFTTGSEQMFATLTLTNGEEQQMYTIPFRWFETPVSNSGNKMMQDIQYLGAINTYIKRYLYLNAFGITDGEVIDGMNTKDISSKNTYTEDVELAKQKKQLGDLCRIYNLDKSEVKESFGITSSTTAGEYKQICIEIIEQEDMKNIGI